jgi:hypothetical protein
MKSLLFVLVKSHNLVFSGLLILARLRHTNKNNNYSRNYFFCIFDKNKQTKQRKETKQNNNKVERLEERDSPCRNPLSPQQRHQKTA